MKDGTITNLRKIVTSFRDPSGKPRIANMAPMPSAEDAGSIYTNFTTHRTSKGLLTTEIALRSEAFIRNEMAGEIWKMLPAEEARKVLAPAICGKLAMSESVTLEDVAADKPIFEMEVVEEEENLEDNSVHSEYAVSVESGITMGTDKTTGSTRARLSKTLEERDKLEEENENLHENMASQQEKIDDLIALLGAQKLDKATAEKLSAITGKGEISGEEDSSDDDESSDGESDDQTTRPTQSPSVEEDTPSDAVSEVTPTRFKRTARKTVQAHTPGGERRHTRSSDNRHVQQAANLANKRVTRGSQGDVTMGSNE